jgi:DNA-binding transcriptional MocR family regulator
VACFATSVANLRYLEQLLTIQIISFDKVNQQRHVLYLQNKANTLALMKKHAAILGPKFRAVLDILDNEIKPLGFASWNRPTGGYFISLNTYPGTAKRALALCQQAGVTMTAAGATFPYGIDPNDANIRVALLYLNTLQEVQELTSTLRHLLRSSKRFQE